MTQIQFETADKEQLERDFILADCERLHEEWSPFYNRVLRTGGLDAQLNLRFEPYQMRMDNLLEELFAKNVQIEGGNGSAAE